MKIYFKNMFEENISQEFRYKNIDETRNYFDEEIKQNELMSKNHIQVCTTLHYIEQFPITGYFQLLDAFHFLLLLL